MELELRYVTIVLIVNRTLYMLFEFLQRFQYVTWVNWHPDANISFKNDHEFFCIFSVAKDVLIRLYWPVLELSDDGSYLIFLQL